jgi:hypothetical protein
MATENSDEVVRSIILEQRWTSTSIKEDHETVFSDSVSSVLGPQLKDVKLLETTA